MASPIRTLVVDDSALIRQLITTVLSEDPEIEVVGSAPDPFAAREMIKELNPDVVTLDVEMPHMDGLTFLKNIMRLRPMPVVMISTLTQAGAEVTLEALEVGAVDFIAKPTTNIAHGLAELSAELTAKVKNAARTRVRASKPTPAAAPPQRALLGRSTGKIVVIGSSTGGVEALKVVLLGMPADAPPILITQHMPPRFTASFAQRLDRECAMTICEAQHNQRVENGHVYIAPGSHHLELIRDGAHFVCALRDGDPVSGHRPSVDVLFRSAAKAAAGRAVASILTGMGKDGAEGMVELRKAGAYTLGQDEASSLVYGMPRVAFERGGVIKQCSLDHMAEAILEACMSDAKAPGAGSRQACA